MKNTNESGRSMVEMLGVLAIIGVLSVGGIMGYTTAMRKYKANEIANTASMLLMLAKSQNNGEGGSLDLTNAGLTAPVANVEMTAHSANNTVVITKTGDDNLATAINQMSVTNVITLSATNA